MLTFLFWMFIISIILSLNAGAHRFDEWNEERIFQKEQRERFGDRK